MKQTKRKWKRLPINLSDRPELRTSDIPAILQISKLFEEGIEDFKHSMGLTEKYIATEMKSTVALESTLVINEWSFDEHLLVKTRASKFDGRKVVMRQQICTDTKVLVTQTTLSISFNIESRKSCKFDQKIARRYKEFIDF